MRGVGARAIAVLRDLGRFGRFSTQLTVAAYRPPMRGRRLVREIYDTGVLSLVIVCISGLAVGMVLALQGHNTLSRFGATGSLGAVVGLSLIRELGPVLTSLLVAGRAGSAMAAEIASMVVTEQLDGLRMMSVDPLDFVVAPKAQAMLLSMPILSTLFVLFGIFGGYVVGVVVLGGDGGSYISTLQDAVVFSDDVLGGFPQGRRLRRAGGADRDVSGLHGAPDLGGRQRRSDIHGRDRIGRDLDLGLLHHRIVGVLSMAESPRQELWVGAFVLVGMAAIAYLSITIGVSRVAGPGAARSSPPSTRSGV